MSLEIFGTMQNERFPCIKRHFLLHRPPRHFRWLIRSRPRGFLCVDEIGSPDRGLLCVDTIGSPGQPTTPAHYWGENGLNRQFARGSENPQHPRGANRCR